MTRVDGATTTNRQVADVAWIRDMRWQKWFSIALGGYQRNDELGLDFRATGGGGVGRYLAQSSRHTWAVYGAAVATQERYAAGSAESGASFIAGTNVSVFIYGEHDLTFDTGVQAIPSLTGSSRIRFEVKSSVNYEFVNDLYLGFNFYDQYDSNPPDETATQNDFGVSTTVGYKW